MADKSDVVPWRRGRGADGAPMHPTNIFMAKTFVYWGWNGSLAGANAAESPDVLSISIDRLLSAVLVRSRTRSEF